MSTHTARIVWESKGEDFKGMKYSRAHSWEFDGGHKMLASSSPAAVKVPFSDPAGVDPEEAFVAAISSCHMLTFLYHAGKGGFEVKRYDDEASGVLGKTPKGSFGITKVTLNPRIDWVGSAPSATQLDELHHKAHKDCFIANSVACEIVVEGRTS